MNIQPRWNNYLQDITDSSNLAFDNVSILSTDDGTVRQVTPEDNLSWEWALVNNDGTKVVLTTAFQMIPSQHKLELCNGIFRLRCTVTDPVSGFVWSRTEPTHLIYTDSEINACPVIFVPIAGYTPTKWMQDAGKLMSFGAGSSYPGQYLVGGKTGDLDNNGTVNTADLLLLLSKFGKP